MHNKNYVNHTAHQWDSRDLLIYRNGIWFETNRNNSNSNNRTIAISLSTKEGKQKQINEMTKLNKYFLYDYNDDVWGDGEGDGDGVVDGYCERSESNRRFFLNREFSPPPWKNERWTMSERAKSVAIIIKHIITMII